MSKRAPGEVTKGICEIEAKKFLHAEPPVPQVSILLDGTRLKIWTWSGCPRDWDISFETCPKRSQTCASKVIWGFDMDEPGTLRTSCEAMSGPTCSRNIKKHQETIDHAPEVS